MTGAWPFICANRDGAIVMIVTLLSAIAGTWIYGYFRKTNSLENYG
jgi:hypothetical protein